MFGREEQDTGAALSQRAMDSEPLRRRVYVCWGGSSDMGGVDSGRSERV